MFTPAFGDRRSTDRRLTDRGRSIAEMIANQQLTPDMAARALVEQLFEQRFNELSGIEIGTRYALADDSGRVGGDLIDVYQFNNGSVAISIADIAGKGLKAATRAALVKYALRAYVSSGLTPAQVLRNLNVLYLETSAFESCDDNSFVSVFLGLIDPDREVLTYASAGHDPVILLAPNQPLRSLPPTGPLIGIDESPKSFHQRFINLRPGPTSLVLGTDGLTEAQSPAGEFIKWADIATTIETHRELPAQMQADHLLRSTFDFCGRKPLDDIAIIVARIT